MRDRSPERAKEALPEVQRYNGLMNGGPTGGSYQRGISLGRAVSGSCCGVGRHLEGILLTHLDRITTPSVATRLGAEDFHLSNVSFSNFIRVYNSYGIRVIFIQQGDGHFLEGAHF